MTSNDEFADVSDIRVLLLAARCWPEEGAALWAAFNIEMDRLYAIMNEGKEPDLDD